MTVPVTVPVGADLDGDPDTIDLAIGDPYDNTAGSQKTGAFYVLFVKMPASMPASAFAGNLAVENHYKVNFNL